MKKRVLSWIIFSVVIIFAIGIISAANVNNYYRIDLNYDKGKLNLLSMDISQSFEKVDNSFGEYPAAVMDYENNVLDINFFNVPNKILYDTVDENGTIVDGGERVLENVNFTLLIPYHYNATKIIIYDENITKKLEIDVSLYSTEYDAYKASINKNTNISEEGQANQQEETHQDKTQTKEETFIEKVSKYWWVLLIILIVLLGIIVNYIRK